MTSTHTHISWTDSTWNPTTGCTKVSRGCDHCYAEALTNRLKLGDFAVIVEHEKRLREVSKFKPIYIAAGQFVPHQVFVNSMSDLFHKDISDEFRDRVFGAMATQPFAIFQILTKRPEIMAAYMDRAFPGEPAPDNVWLGVSCEDDRVYRRLDMLRAIKRAHPGTVFVSVEPLIGTVARHHYAEIDWVLIGGESRQGKELQRCDAFWVCQARDLARKAGAAIWFKQWGDWSNNPLYAEAESRLIHGECSKHIDKVRYCIDHGEREAAIETDHSTGRVRITGEKGGATLEGEVLHERPPAYAKMAALINQRHAMALA